MPSTPSVETPYWQLSMHQYPSWMSSAARHIQSQAFLDMAVERLYRVKVCNKGIHLVHFYLAALFIRCLLLSLLNWLSAIWTTSPWVVMGLLWRRTSLGL